MNEVRGKSPSAISRTRLEFLFDGIFAIAMTILVLELKVPELVDRRSVGELASALHHHASTFGSYLLSFLMLGMFWYRHNQHYPHYQTITRVMLGLHFVQLAAAAFFPFCAALFGRYPTNNLGSVIYIGCVLVYMSAALANWVVARRSGALGCEVTDAEYQRIRNRTMRGVVIIFALFGFFLSRILAG